MSNKMTDSPQTISINGQIKLFTEEFIIEQQTGKEIDIKSDLCWKARIYLDPAHCQTENEKKYRITANGCTRNLTIEFIFQCIHYTYQQSIQELYNGNKSRLNGMVCRGFDFDGTNVYPKVEVIKN